MAHYALINKDNIVVQVITGVDENETQVDTDGTVVGGSSSAWELFYSTRPWFAGLTCKRTSYNKNIRKNFAGVGYTYNKELDAFISPKPYPSWKLNLDSCVWEPPVPMPEPSRDFLHVWIEENQEWVSRPFN